MVWALGAVLEPTHLLSSRCDSTVSKEQFTKISLSRVGSGRWGRGTVISWAASGKPMMSQPPQLGSPPASPSRMMLTMMKMKAVVDSLLWPVENTVA